MKNIETNITADSNLVPLQGVGGLQKLRVILPHATLANYVLRLVRHWFLKELKDAFRLSMEVKVAPPISGDI